MSGGQILGAIAGAAIAYFTGGIGSVLMGASLGSKVGGLLDSKSTNTQGPRLSDLKVTASTYGVGLPILYGTERLGGNVFWSTDKLEIATTESAGGKGGSSTATSYAYYVHMTLGLCQTPIDGSTVGIVQIFKDGELIWDQTWGTSIAQALVTTTDYFGSLQLFQGDESQLPDPIQETWNGVGNVPAYRGIVSVRMIAIECPGGRIPQFTFTLTTTPGAAQSTALLPLTNNNLYAAADGSFWSTVYNLSNYMDVYWSDGSTAWVKQRTIATTPVYTYIGLPTFIVGAATPLMLSGKGFVDPVSGTTYSVVDVIDITTGGQTQIYSGPFSNPGPGYSGLLRAAFDRKTGSYAMSQDLGSSLTIAVVTNGVLLECDTTAITLQGQPLAMDSGVVYSLGIASGNYQIVCKDGVTGAHIGVFPGPATGAVDVFNSALQSDDANIYAYLYKVPNASQSSFYTLGITKDSFGHPTAIAFNLVSAEVNFIGGGSSSSSQGVAVYPKSSGLVVGADSAGHWQYTSYAAYAPVPVKASSIIIDQCKRAGESRYDVSTIPDSDTVTGYKLSNPASARANLEPLMAALQYYMVDEDGLIKFKRYEDITSVASVAYTQLAQAEDGSEPGDPMPLTRTQQIDLARSITVSYVEQAIDFQTATEIAIRMVTTSTQDQSVELPICMTSTQAKSAAQMILFDQWIAQNIRTCKVSRQFAYVSPGDGVTIEYPQGTFRMWRLNSASDDGVMLSWTLQLANASLYTQIVQGAAGYSKQVVTPLPAPTRSQILDMPILQDADNNASLYVAMESFAGNSANAQLFLGGSGDSNFVSQGSVTSPAPIGFAETVPGAWVSTGIDETNLFTVDLGTGDNFPSCTRDVLIAGGGQYWAFGAPGRWEIGASAVSNNLGSGRFTLSRHLRGQFGTEPATGLHVAGDIFVLLNAPGMLRPSMSVGDIGATKTYRAVSVGRTLDSVASTFYANTGQGLMPYSPINLRRSVDASNNVTYTFDPRSRLSFNNMTGTAQLGETLSSFAIDFFSSNTFATRVGTVTSATPSVTLTAAQATAWGLTPGAANFINVYQISGQVGAGHSLQATL